MMDSDKERDDDTETGRGTKGKPGGKRKRKNMNYADLIGFPKDKVVLKRVEALINLVINPLPIESQIHPSDIAIASARRKQTSIGDFAKGGREGSMEGELQVQQFTAKEKMPGWQVAKPGGGSGRGRGRGGGLGRGRGGGAGGSSSHGSSVPPTMTLIKDEGKQKVPPRISEYMLPGRAEDTRYVAELILGNYFFTYFRRGEEGGGVKC